MNKEIFKERLRNKIGEEISNFNEPIILSYFYYKYGWLIKTFLNHKFDDIREYLNFLELELHLDSSYYFNFLELLKTDYQNILAEIDNLDYNKISDLDIKKYKKIKFNNEMIENRIDILFNIDAINQADLIFMSQIHNIHKIKDNNILSIIKNKIIPKSFIMDSINTTKSKFKTFIRQIENELSMNKKYISEESNAELENTETKKPNKKINKFVFQGNEESILRIIDLLYNAGFITTESYKIRNAIIRDTFQKLDENNQVIDFKNTQLNSVFKQRVKEENKLKADNKDISKFRKLQKSLNNTIPD